MGIFQSFLMESESEMSDDWAIKPSMIFNGEKWIDPPSTSTETEAGTQGFVPRYAHTHLNQKLKL